jgi:uncharacterized protein
MTHTNRLASEKSPYLQQHAHNPVEWYPWGEEAFATARDKDKPIFLSIGYSTCHWCHVMERESFEDEAVANLLNANFISIKVDREERPDVDGIYMSALQAMTGAGGWPMSIFLTPELKPFFAGTYFPPKPAYGRPSFTQLLERIHELWMTERDSVLESGEHIVSALQSQTINGESSNSQLDITNVINETYRYFERSFDQEQGGFGGAPKFPRPVQFDFLFHYYASYGRKEARDMSLFTLRKMADGGIRDHLGGGFHRYSVDRIWRVSHFEKMLYDQAQLAESYLDAWQLTQDTFYSAVTRDILDYVLRDMTHPAGGFFSAEDADSEGEEGKFYAWSATEIESTLGADSEPFAFYYGITHEGNFEHGKNVLHVTHSFEETASRFGMDAINLDALLGRSKKILFEEREKRIRPLRDDKVLTSWNGLMIGAMARGGDLLGEKRYIEAAKNAAEFIWTNLRPSGKLLHRWREGEARFDAYLESYAFFIKGLLELYEATFEVVWLERAIELQREQDSELYDDSSSGYFTNREALDLLMRTKSDYDGAEPSGNSIATLNLFRLAQFTENSDYRERAERTLKLFAAKVEKYPYAMPELISAAFWTIKPPMQIVFAGEELKVLKAEANTFYLPLGVKMLASQSIGEFAKILDAKDGQATAYICRNFKCELPVSDPSSLSKILQDLSVE